MRMLNARLIPQADRLERVGEFVLLTGLGSTTLRDLLFAGRDKLYYAAAAVSLGLLEEGDEISDSGAALAERPAAVMHNLATSLERSPVGKAWAEWAGARLAEVDGSTAEAFLEANTELSASTLARRAQTLRKWLDAARPFLESAVLPPDPSWRALQQLVPDAVRDVTPERVAQIPTRVLTHCSRHGIATIGALLQWSEQDLADAKGMGAKSIRDLRRALKRFVESFTGSSSKTAAFAPDNLADALELLVERLDQRAKEVLRRRLALGVPYSTLEEIAQEQGVSRERVRQIERDAFDELGRLSQFQELFHHKLHQALADRPAVEYARLGGWWPESTENVFRMVFKYLGPEDILVESWGDSALLRRADAPSLEEAYEAMDAWLKAQSLPLNSAYMDLELGPKVADPYLRAMVRARLLERWSVASTRDGEMIVDRGSTRRARILEYLLSSPSPVAIKELEEQFGRGALPEEAVYVRRGLVTLPDHLPGFEDWAHRLAGPLEAYVTAQGPDRQWMAHRLLEYASSIAKLPEWITPMLLAHMLERSGRFEYLGRQRLKLPGAEVEERTQLLPKLTELVEAAGGPVADDDLHQQLKQHVEVLEQTYVLLRTTPPLFRMDDGRIGLMPRDLPGGQDAVESVVGALVRAVDAAGRELSFDEALEAVQGHGGSCSEWTIGHIRGVARMDDVLKPTRSSIGVDASSDVERYLLDEEVSAASTAAEPAGHHPAVGTESENAVVLPSARELALPRDARSLYTRLTEELVGDLDELARRVQGHAAEFEDASRRSEFLPVAEARAIAGSYPKLLAHARKDGGRLFLALAWVVGRYFEISDDGTLDFSIGGLDDDVAVFNAVARYMSAADLEIEQDF